MSTPTLPTLIAQLEQDLPGASPVERVATARLRSATLSDLGDQLVDHFVAQARESGHSWSQIGDALGVSRQAAQQRPGRADFSRFTDRARQVLVLAQDAARAHNGIHITSEHILHGVLGVPEGLGAQAVEQLSGSSGTVREELRTLFPRDTATPPARLNYAEITRRLLDESVQAALLLRHNYIGTEHILLGVLRVDCPAAALLNHHGVTLEATNAAVTERIAAILAAGRSGPGGTS
jgi:hypothetical protein